MPPRAAEVELDCRKGDVNMYMFTDEAGKGGLSICYSEIATMSIIDLSKVDKMVESFNTFAKSMYDSAANSATFSAMSKKITKIDNFGGNNKSEGYTNMVDYGGLRSRKSTTSGATTSRKATPIWWITAVF